MAEDWDLQAVVRGCCTTASSSSATTTTVPEFHQMDSHQFSQFYCLPDPFEARNVIGDLHELYKPFFPQSNPRQKKPPQEQSPAASVSTTASTLSTNTFSTNNRSKRRKNQTKKVCQVPAESVSSDAWSWRKYGQKPIKGSPYPRGYYKCSSSKGCLARKQVERNRSDPGMFIVTYTEEHSHPVPTHRNSLAGSTRQKHLTSQTATTSDSSKASSSKPSCSSPAISMEEDMIHQNSTIAESRPFFEDLLEEEDEFGMSDAGISDDFFEGLEEFSGNVPGDCLTGNLQGSFSHPWFGNHAATAAGSG